MTRGHSPFVVVPSHDFNHPFIKDHVQRQINGRRIFIAPEVNRYEFIIIRIDNASVLPGSGFFKVLFKSSRVTSFFSNSRTISIIDTSGVGTRTAWQLNFPSTAVILRNGFCSPGRRRIIDMRQRGHDGNLYVIRRDLWSVVYEWTDIVIPRSTPYVSFISFKMAPDRRWS